VSDVKGRLKLLGRFLVGKLTVDSLETSESSLETFESSLETFESSLETFESSLETSESSLEIPQAFHQTSRNSRTPPTSNSKQYSIINASYTTENRKKCPLEEGDRKVITQKQPINPQTHLRSARIRDNQLMNETVKFRIKFSK
jgi:hypothetical protein